MKEQEFTDLTDSQRVIEARKILKDIVPTLSTIITETEYGKVTAILDGWFRNFGNLDFIDS